MLFQRLAGLRAARLSWPVWVWRLVGFGAVVLVTAMALGTIHRGNGVPVTGTIRAAPLSLRRSDSGSLAPGRGLGPMENRAAARRGLEAVQRWQAWMDSLKRTAGGIAIYDSILWAHPGLLDTAKEVEDYYLKQLK